MPDVAAVIVAAGRGIARGRRSAQAIPADRWRDHAAAGAVHVRRTCRGRPRTAGYSSEDRRPLSSSTAGIDRSSAAGRSAAPPGRPRCAPASKRSAARKPDIVLIHDAARPFASAALVSRAIAAAQRSGAAIPALPVTDTVKTRRCRRPGRQDARPQYVAAGADAARFRLRRRCSTRIAAPPPRAARISPTMPRSPNGPA